VPEAVELKVRVLFANPVEDRIALEITREVVRRIENLKVEGVKEIAVIKECFGLEVEP